MSFPFIYIVILNCNIVSCPVTVGVLHSLPIKGINLILWNHLVGENVTAVPYTLNSPEEITDNTDEVIVYPACAVTRAMVKDAQVA